MPFSNTTTTIAIASCGIPATSASSAATQSMTAKKCVICAASWRNGDGGEASEPLLGPSRPKPLGGLSRCQPARCGRESLSREPRLSEAVGHTDPAQLAVG